MFICPDCNRESGHYAHGVCQSCYMKRRRAAGGAAFRAHSAKLERERRQRLGDEYRERDRERNKLRREYRLAYCRDYYRRNTDRSKERHRKWRKDNPGLRDLRKRRYRTRKLGLIATLTVAEWQAIKDGFDGRCVYCNRKMQRLTQEHIIPVVQGGNYTVHNIVPACHSCNSRKHTSTGFEYLIRLATEKRTGTRMPGPPRRR